MRIIFAGTPDFAAHTLIALCETGHEIICVYTQPDRKTGRGQKLSPPAVKRVALDQKIEVRQPLSFKPDEEFNALEALKPDLIIVVAYGMILPQRILDIPKIACLNIHASLLPRWRGAAPIQRAIEAGDKKTGICIMQMEAGLDTGPIVSQSTLTIEKNDTSSSLHDKLAILGAETLLDTLYTLEALEKKLANIVVQDHESATYAHKISKSEANIDWNENAALIQQRIRAFNPWPVCQSYCNTQRLRIWQANVLNIDSHSDNGTIIAIDKTGIQISCGQSVLNIQVLQRDGSKPMPVKDFINSSELKIGDFFSLESKQ